MMSILIVPALCKKEGLWINPAVTAFFSVTILQKEKVHLKPPFFGLIIERVCLFAQRFSFKASFKAQSTVKAQVTYSTGLCCCHKGMERKGKSETKHKQG